MGIFSKHDTQNIHDIAEGNVAGSTRAIKEQVPDPAPPFYRMIVLEVISDPWILSPEKISYFVNVLGVTNSRFANSLPRNTIIAQRVYTATNPVTSPMFLFPFFPSHLALPCKPGEMVWAMFEDPNSQMKEIGYWFCRITEPHVADDVNLTYHATQLDASLIKGTKDRYDASNTQQDQSADAQSKLIPIYELRNGLVVVRKDGTKETLQHTELLRDVGSMDNEEIIEDLVVGSDGGLLQAHEDVPRFKKRPGDVVLEGSNNSLIVLGSDRSGPIATYDEKLREEKPPRMLTPSYPKTDLTGSAGSIDLVVGRGNGRGAPALTKVIRYSDGEQLFRTVAKSMDPEILRKNEGDPDFSTDRSRVLISQRTMTDKKFEVGNYMFQRYGIEDSSIGNASVVIKSDKIRLIARQDIALMVTNFTSVIPKSTISGSVGQDIIEKRYFKSVGDESNWASIVIKSDGNIVFTPSKNGFIKLGGDDANKAILCTDFVADTNKVPGEVNALPIASNGGGFVGTANGNIDEEAANRQRAPDLGTFSKKVLIK
jgi:hypothetical protein